MKFKKIIKKQTEIIKNKNKSKIKIGFDINSC